MPLLPPHSRRPKTFPSMHQKSQSQRRSPHSPPFPKRKRLTSIRGLRRLLHRSTPSKSGAASEHTTRLIQRALPLSHLQCYLCSNYHRMELLSSRLYLPIMAPSGFYQTNRRRKTRHPTRKSSHPNNTRKLPHLYPRHLARPQRRPSQTR